MTPTQLTGYAFEPAPVNPNALFDEMGEPEADSGAGGEAIEVSSPYAGDDAEPSPAPMQTSAQTPRQPISEANEGELGMLRQFFLDAGILADRIPSGRQQMLNLLHLRMEDGPNTNA
ncbi:hypothetical protein BWQ96_00356 [Gracilariopsis chorda]|uniref:Uncharacterized protein n=1 Tax=Gracilariopsis chorda TaxID=448386 RepID=A0A2V3J5Q0_9FLOR|nr:hypothetical protein BWQ96_00356 [Gracilariopsis chorda]|eukprot:PXF49704.1 hypothetical protein BWQ96_00356 [Gracilariopsis chorda]